MHTSHFHPFIRRPSSVSISRFIILVLFASIFICIFFCLNLNSISLLLLQICLLICFGTTFFPFLLCFFCGPIFFKFQKRSENLIGFVYIFRLLNLFKTRNKLLSSRTLWTFSHSFLDNAMSLESHWLWRQRFPPFLKKTVKLCIHVEIFWVFVNINYMYIQGRWLVVAFKCWQTSITTNENKSQTTEFFKTTARYKIKLQNLRVSNIVTRAQYEPQKSCDGLTPGFL